MNKDLLNHIVNMLKASAEMVNKAYLKGSLVQNRYYYGKITALFSVLVLANHETEIETSVGEYKLNYVTEIYEVVENIRVDKKIVFKKED